MFLKRLWACVCRVLRCLRCRPVYRRRRRAAPIPYRPDPSYVVLRFKDEIDVLYQPGQTQRLEPIWAELKSMYEGIELLQIFRSVSPDELRAIYKKEGGGEGRGRAPNFVKYFQVVGPRKPAEFADIARTLRERKSDVLAEVYTVHPGPLPASTVDTGDPGFPEQFHLHPAPDPLGWAPGGVGAEAAWLRPGSDGSGDGKNPVRFVDVEKGWDLGHPDLPQNPQPALLRGDNNPDSAAHGTAVLGIVCGQDGNNLAGVGLAPRASVKVSAYWELRPNAQKPDLDIEDAILAAVNNFLQAGDVLLIEAQIYATEDPADTLMLPVEVHPLIFNLISWAVWGRKIIVVEPGGDGTNMQFPPLDMDTWPRPAPGPQLLVRDANHDSGAIMVSAAQPSWFDPTDIQPPPWAPVGLRIDCFAWGDGVYTCWPAAAPSQCQEGGAAAHPYTFCFSGTSAAAATIAGAAIVLQGIYRHRHAGNSLLPDEMRRWLGDQTNGVNTLPSVDAQGNVHRIGAMPNLAVLQQRIPLPPSP